MKERRRWFIVFVIFSVLLSQSTFLADSSKSSKSFDNSHIIKGVPYISMETGRECELSSIAMLVNYLGKNYSLHELFYLIGAGHAISYIPPRRLSNIISKCSPPTPWMGSTQCFWEEDWYFISNLLGMRCNISYIENYTDKETAWNQYWTRVKGYIKQDLPVYTQINMSKLSYYQHKEGFPSKYNMCHAIVIVGYNESNNTVCYNDGEPGFEGHPEEGFYIYENLSNFRDAVITADESTYVIYKKSFCTITLENVSKGLSKSVACEIAFVRNMAKMRGLKWAYDPIFLTENNIVGEKAVKAFKRDMKTWKVLLKIPMWQIMNKIANKISGESNFPFNTSLEFLKIISEERSFASETMIKNCRSNRRILLSAYKLENESKKWNELLNMEKDFVNTILSRRFSMMHSIFLLVQINRIINEIIDIENEMLLS